MAKYLNNIKSFQDLKAKYRNLLKVNHPDNGGNLETMQEINCEYDALFTIWKDRAAKDNALTEEEKTETARSTKRHFYSAYGWEGSRYDSNLTLKEIAKIVRNYVKEKYPTTKWSIRTHYASMCQSLSVDLLEFPEKMYLSPDDLRNAEMTEKLSYEDKNGEKHFYDSYMSWANELLTKLHRNDFLPDSYYPEEIYAAYEKALKTNESFYGVKTEYFKSVIDDVQSFVQSYNYDDSDSMTDYFDVNFYDGKVDYSNCKYVPKVARIKEVKNEMKPSQEPTTEETAQIELKNCLFTIEKSEHTKTHEVIYLVNYKETLSRDDYIKLSNKMKDYGGYYSKFTHSFIFKEDPTAHLENLAI